MPVDTFKLVARLLLSVVFIANGVMKLTSLSGTAAYFASLGFPAPDTVALATGLFETIGGLAVAVGLGMRISATLLAVFCVAAGVIGHGTVDDPDNAFFHFQALLKDISLSGGFLAVAVAGPGRYSIDTMRRRRS